MWWYVFRDVLSGVLIEGYQFRAFFVEFIHQSNRMIYIAKCNYIFSCDWASFISTLCYAITQACGSGEA